MKRSASAVLVAVALAVIAAGSASATVRAPRLRAVRTWAFAIGDGDLGGDLSARYAGYDLVVVDGQQASVAQVRALHAAGTVVLGYLDVGAIERGRPWYRAARRYRLDYWGDWGEWYADVDAPGYRRLLAGRVAPRILAKGFDGLFLDNADMIETHPGQGAGMHALVRRLARLVHRRHELLFGQNGADVIGPTLSVYDGWNLEDVSATYDFARHRYVHQPAHEVAGAAASLRRIARAGVLVLSTDYTAATDAAGAAAAVATSCAAGAIPFVSDIGLRRIPAPPARCG